jgi:peptide/nickel transport system substrate-binding protein
MEDGPAIARVGRTADIATLNPVMLTELNSAAVVTQLYDHLLELDADFNYVPRGLVKSWSISPDGDIVDFELREGVRFHDDSELTAEDVTFTFRAALGPGNPRLIAACQDAGFEAASRYKLRIWLPSASASCLASLVCLPLLPKHVYDGGHIADRPVADRPVGGGAFRFGEWRKGEYVSILAFEDYHSGRPGLDCVEFTVFDSAEAAAEALLSGDIDYVPDAGAGIARSLDGCRGVDVRWSDAATVMYLAFNLDAPPVRDLRVRRAIAHAIDRQGLVHEVAGGAAVIADTLVPPRTFWRNEELIAHDYNVAQASALLDAAGWRVTDSSGMRRNSARLPMELPILAIAGDQAKERAAWFIAADLRRVGIDAAVRTFEAGALLEQHIYPRDYKAAVLASDPGRDPAFLTTFYHSAMLAPAGGNWCAYRNPLVDQLLEDSLSLTRDRFQRKEMLDEVQRIVAADLPHVTLYNPRLANLSSARLRLPADALSHGDDLTVLRRWKLAD